MKKKKNQENRVSMVCEPVAGYNCTPARSQKPILSPNADMDELMSVEEYFGILRTMVNEYYDNLQSVD